jgi:DNA-binding transcriptional LysR family regulator
MSNRATRLDLGKLEVFLEAARCGNYTAAARRLHVTQSAVSHAIRKLEDGLGRTLVEWRRRRFALTDDGEYVRQVCEQVFHDLGQAEQVLASRAPGRSQWIVVGATVEFGTTVLVRKLRPLLDALPWLHVDFRFRDDLAPLLLRDEIDLAVDCIPHAHPSVQATRLFREKYLMVASPAFLEAHPVRRTIDLERVPVLSLDKDGAWWANALRSVAGVRRPVLGHVIEVNQVRGMVHAALEGYGVALLPKYTVLGKVARGDLKALFPRLGLLEDWFCVYQKRASAGRQKNRVVTEFLMRLDVSEFGDAITPSRGAGGATRGHPA